jgi:hypothetical protein
MKFELKEVKKDKTPRFEIEVEYEHGDSDYHNRILTILESDNFKDLEKYITKFNEIKNNIKKNRRSSQDFPKEYQEQFADWEFYFPIDGLDVGIELERDVYCNDEMLAYFADIEIMSLFYFDENDCKFEVLWQE